MIKRGLAVLFITLLLATAGPSLAADKDTYKQLNLFGDVFERVQSEYVEETEDSALIESAINGMLSALDPHSSFLNAKQYRDMQHDTRGEFGGLGIEVTMESGLVKVVSPIDDTPAFRAGVQAGDYVTHLDGEAVMGLSLNEAVERMRGKVNTKIKLTIRRADVADAIDIEITRAIIKIKSVRSRAEKDAAYVRITSFNAQTTKGLKNAINKLKSDIGKDMEGLILDLRNNPGGLLDQAVAVSNAFLERGEIVSTRGRKASDIQRFNARKGDLIDGKPIIVLINGGSASASEIVAGALQDHRRAIILGTRSFGKGSVQTIVPIGQMGAVRMTTARYYTPSGESIQAKGITPDVEIEQAKLEVIKRPSMRSEADLRNHLEAGEKDAADKVKGQNTNTKPNGTEGGAGDTADSKDDLQDYQLDYALNLLHGLALVKDSIGK